MAGSKRKRPDSMIPSEKARQDLENDHHQLMEIFAGAIASSRSCDIEAPCNHVQCPEGSNCARAVREQFHRIMFACIGRFGSEEKVLHHSLTPDNFQRHAESHGDITSRIHRAISSFSASKDVPAAFENIKSIARAYEVHHQILDNALSPDDAPGGRNPGLLTSFTPLPPLPLTGNEMIDREHALLFDQLQQALSICTCTHEQCTDCTGDRRQHCMTSTIELIGEALKFMVEHFRHEEEQIRVMPVRRIAEAHMRAHARIAQQIGQLIEDYEDEDTARCLYSLVNALHGWLVDHVKEYDVPLYLSLARHDTGQAVHCA